VTASAIKAGLRIIGRAGIGVDNIDTGCAIEEAVTRELIGSRGSHHRPGDAMLVKEVDPLTGIVHEVTGE